MTTTALQHWTSQSQVWLKQRRDEVWQAVKTQVATDAKQGGDAEVVTDKAWTLKHLAAIQIHLQYVFSGLFATNQTRVFAYRPWLMRLLEKQIIDELPIAIATRFGVSPKPPQPFEFTTENLSRALGLCGVPLQAEEIQNLGSRRFDPVSAEFVTDGLERLPCAHKAELQSWVEQKRPYMGELDNDPRPIASIYHTADRVQLHAADVKRNFSPGVTTVDGVLLSIPTAVLHFMTLADALFTRTQLRYWAAQLHYRDPRIWRTLRRLANGPQINLPHGAVLLQALLAMQPNYPAAATTTWSMLTNPNSAKEFEKLVQLPTNVPFTVAVPTPLFTADRWFNTEWADANTLRNNRPWWKPDTVDLSNDWQFQRVFDCVLPAFHYHLCHRYAMEYDDAFPLLLVRSDKGYRQAQNIIQTQVRVYVMVKTNGVLYSTDTPLTVWPDDAWFVVGLIRDANADLGRGIYEEYWTKPAPNARDELRATKCSFFRRFIPDDDSQPVPDPGVAAPFTLLPLAGFR